MFVLFLKKKNVYRETYIFLLLAHIALNSTEKRGKKSKLAINFKLFLSFVIQIARAYIFAKQSQERYIIFDCCTETTLTFEFLEVSRLNIVAHAHGIFAFY